MLSITKFGQHFFQLKEIFPVVIIAPTKICPAKKKVPKCPHTARSKKPSKSSTPKGPKGIAKGPVCPGPGAPGSGGDSKRLMRALIPGKVRMGLIPEEWFLFFHSKTGVTGPYIFGIMLTNYLVSKEKFIMEHEYYVGLSIFVMAYYVTTNFGRAVGAALDKEVDAIASKYEKIRTDELNVHKNVIKLAQAAQSSAEGQKLLMDAKKENIAMQLEAIYRERAMHVYTTVKGRMEYQVKLYRAQARIQQKWMLGWILSNVMKSITPELEKQALNRAIEDLAGVASRATPAKPDAK